MGGQHEPSLPGLGPGNSRLDAELRAALQAKGLDYQPRTRHLRADGSPVYTNRLIRETSPYLLQHAHNPVSWFPWGDEAFARARDTHRLIFLSVGYSTCHWCHVMEEESFEDVEVARYLNENFVAIKVDREERPDVDALYMKAVELMTGSGGWPMTLVLNTEREPIFAGTYFPARDGDRGARMGLLSILQVIQKARREKPEQVAEQARVVTEKVRVYAQGAPVQHSVPGAAVLRQAATALASRFDAENGGFGKAPKFPRPADLAVLARVYRRTQDFQLLQMVTVTLDHMARGGMWDHLGGGFHRYSTDARWHVPHFEKMLYDQALLVSAYLEGYQLTGREEFAQVAQETLTFLLRDLSAPAGGFYSALDADSLNGRGEHEEGAYYTWSREELDRVLGPDRGPRIAAYFGASPTGDASVRSVLWTPRPLPEVAKDLGVTSAALDRELAQAKPLLLAARSKRSAPMRDDKVLTAWNGLAISAFARAARVLNEPTYADRARRTADFLLTHARKDGRLFRSYAGGRPNQPGNLSDYAFVVQGLLDLHEATQDVRWLEEALALNAALERHFWDELGGGFYLTADDAELLLAREKPDYDGAEPSGNSVAALNLLRLAELTGEARYRRMAERVFAMAAAQLGAGVGLPNMLAALDFALDSPPEVALVAPRGGTARSLEEVMRRSFLPNRVLAIAEEGPELSARAAVIPLLAHRAALHGQPTAYVCHQRVCDLPTTDGDVFRRQLAHVEPLTPEPRP